MAPLISRDIARFLFMTCSGRTCSQNNSESATFTNPSAKVSQCLPKAQEFHGSTGMGFDSTVTPNDSPFQNGLLERAGAWGAQRAIRRPLWLDPCTARKAAMGLKSGSSPQKVKHGSSPEGGNTMEGKSWIMAHRKTHPKRQQSIGAIAIRVLCVPVKVHRLCRSLLSWNLEA